MDRSEGEVLFECYFANRSSNSPLFSLWHSEGRLLKLYKALDLKMHKRLRQMRGRSMQEN